MKFTTQLCEIQQHRHIAGPQRAANKFNVVLGPFQSLMAQEVKEQLEENDLQLIVL